jgi:hypothetical protein
MDDLERQQLVDTLVKRIRGALAEYDAEIQFDVLWEIIATDDDLLQRLNQTISSPTP